MVQPPLLGGAVSSSLTSNGHEELELFRPPSKTKTAVALPPRPPKSLGPTKAEMNQNSTRNAQQAAKAIKTDDSSSNAHFLHGFNVESCSDLLSIPDPPTPQPKNRRRLSSPLVNVRSLGDLTNQAGPEMQVTKVVPNKRSRKSLCHVPSPIVVEDRREPTEEPTEDFRPPVAKTLQVNICMDEEDEEERVGSPSKRRKKRQSFVMPSSDILATTTTEEQVSCSYFSPPQQRESAQTELAHNNKNALSVAALQQLVRSYCSLPLENRGASGFAKTIEESTGYPLCDPSLSSDDQEGTRSYSSRRFILQRMAPAIQAMDQRRIQDTELLERRTQCRVEKSRSGKYRYYSITTNEKVSTNEYENRYLQVIHKTNMEKTAQAQEWITQFHAEKTIAAGDGDRGTSNASQVVETFKVEETGRGTSSDHQQVEESADDSSMKTDKLEEVVDQPKLEGRERETPPNDKHEKDQVEATVEDVAMQDELVYSAKESSEREAQESAFSASSEHCDDGPVEEDTAMNDEIVESIKDGLGVEESRRQTDNKTTSPPLVSPTDQDGSYFNDDVVDDDDEMEICDTSTSFELDEGEASMECPLSASVVEAEVVESIATKSESMAPSAPVPSASRKETAQSPAKEMLLPLPSREAESDDPHIAQAEQKLWDTIDAALENYSREILAITAAKQVRETQA
jgi:hypothetical protein